MKRTTLIILTAVYIISCVGMSVSRLYCCGKLTSVSFSYGADDNAPGQMHSNKKCCGHEKQSFKVKDNHFNSAPLALNHPLPVIISSFIQLNDQSVVNLLNTHSVFRGNAPPGHLDIPAYTLYCSYRI